MFVRIATGLILTPAVLAVTWYLPDTGGVILAGLAGMLAMDEFARMTRPAAGRDLAWKSQMILTALLIYSAACRPGWLPLILFMGAAVPLIIRMIKAGDLSDAMQDVSVQVLGMIWIALPVVLIVQLFVLPEVGKRLILTLFAIVWMGDSGAYFGGKYLGRHKLYPAISPKKTVEGGVFGLVGSVVGAAIMKLLFDVPISWAALIPIAILGGVLEQVGDFCESMLKRSANVKDSGNILPGHGGLFDRIDGLLFATPVVYAWLIFA